MKSITIDMLRGGAALWVFSFHLCHLMHAFPRPLQALAAHGSLGVPLFFVVSGYCICVSAMSLREKDNGVLLFLKRRFVRIFPPFWASIAVIVMLPYAEWAILRFHNPTLPAPHLIRFSAAEWFGVVTLTRIFFTNGEDVQVIFGTLTTVYWTLAIEVQFYLIMALAIACRRYRGRYLIFVTFLSGVILVLDMPLTKGCALWYWPMFAMGIGAYYLQRTPLTLKNIARNAALPASMIACTLLCAGIIGLIVAGVVQELFRLVFRRVMWGFAFTTALFLWCAAPLEPWLAAVAAQSRSVSGIVMRCMTRIGGISYSVYLLHSRFSAVLERLMQPALSTHPRATVGVIITATLVLCAGFSYIFERPFKSRRQ